MGFSCFCVPLRSYSFFLLLGGSVVVRKFFGVCVCALSVHIRFLLRPLLCLDLCSFLQILRVSTRTPSSNVCVPSNYYFGVKDTQINCIFFSVFLSMSN